MSSFFGAGEFGSGTLAARQSYCRNGYYERHGRCYSAWSWYGRWILAAVAIGLCVLIFILWA